ncbi:hypothetical protein SAMN05428950_101898 [Sphingomonas sp. OV641]|uniref:hypothetical protein n=1 Tax=Sphingomonas sp. OV641 TaxID=1881068 RepID=UPI0008D4B0AA|nr:hypothetical protein [Sphingomonas sp. OV641]SEJ02953.1 hypothetical protein SAMN05428950_101898 [Sphingomonas sp. OV641]
MLDLDRNDNMRAFQHDALRLSYQRKLATGEFSQMEGEAYVFTIYGSGVGAALGLPSDEVTANGVRLESGEGPSYEFLHLPEVSRRLAGLPRLRYRFAKVRPDGALVPRFGGQFVIEPSPDVDGITPDLPSEGGSLLIIERLQPGEEDE